MMARARDNDPPPYEQAAAILEALEDDPNADPQEAYEALRDLGYSGDEAVSMIHNPTGWVRALRVGPEGDPVAPPPVEGDGEISYGMYPEQMQRLLRRADDDDDETAGGEEGVGGGGRRPALRGFRPAEGDDGDEGDVIVDEDAGTVRVFRDGSWGTITIEQAESLGILPEGGDDGDEGDDDGDMTEAEVDAELATMSDPEAQWVWLQENAGRMDSATFEHGQEVITANAESQGIDLTPPANPVGEALAADDDATLAEMQGAATSMEQQAEQHEAALAEATAAASEVWQNTAPGVTPDFSSIDEEIPPNLSPAERERFRREAIQQGREEAVAARAEEIQGATGVGEDEARQIADADIASDDLFGTTTPDWLLQINGGDLSPQQKARYVEYWNDAYGTFYRTFDQLAPVLESFDGTEAEAQNFATAVLADQEPLQLQGITLPLVQGERTATYTVEELDAMRAMGFSNDAITRAVRLAAIAGGEVTPGAVGDTLNVASILALARYYGGGDEFAAFTQQQQDIADIETQLGLEPGEWSSMTVEERAEFREQFEGGAGTRPDGQGGWEVVEDPRLELAGRLETLTRAMGTRDERGTLPGIIASNNAFQAGLDLYRGDEMLSLIHAVDPALAQRIAATGGDPEKLGWEDNAAAYDILERAGQTAPNNVLLQKQTSVLNEFGFFDVGGGGGGGGGGGAGPQRRVLDKEGVRSGLQQMWSRLLPGSEVSDAEVDALYGRLQAQLDSSEPGMDFDVSARIEAFVRGQDVYDELYRNKPKGMDELDYQAPFAAGVQDVLGAEADVGALTAGMRTGQYQTAVGRAGATEKLLTNSTLRGRWAQAKQTLDRFS